METMDIVKVTIEVEGRVIFEGDPAQFEERFGGPATAFIVTGFARVLDGSCEVVYGEVG